MGVSCSQENIANQQSVISSSRRCPPIAPRPPVPLFQSSAGGATASPRVRDGAVAGDVGRVPSSSRVPLAPKPPISVAGPVHDYSFRRGPPLPYHPLRTSRPSCPPNPTAQQGEASKPVLPHSANTPQHSVTRDGSKGDGVAGSSCTGQTALGTASASGINGASSTLQKRHLHLSIGKCALPGMTVVGRDDKRKRSSCDVQDTEASPDRRLRHLTLNERSLPSIEVDGDRVEDNLSGKGGARKDIPLVDLTNESDSGESTDGKRGAMKDIPLVDLTNGSDSDDSTYGTESGSPSWYRLRQEVRGASPAQASQRQREKGAPSPDPRAYQGRKERA